MDSRFVRAQTPGVLFLADSSWGRTSLPVALPPKSSPSPLPVGALAKAWTPSVCHPASLTTRRRRRALSLPWTPLMNLRKRYTCILFTWFLTETPDVVFAAWESLFSGLSLFSVLKVVFIRAVKASSVWGPIPYRNRSKHIWPWKYCSGPISNGGWRTEARTWVILYWGGVGFF